MLMVQTKEMSTRLFSFSSDFARPFTRFFVVVQFAIELNENDSFKQCTITLMRKKKKTRLKNNHKAKRNCMP